LQDEPGEAKKREMKPLILRALAIDQIKNLTFIRDVSDLKSVSDF
jgi:hypothetical protein